MPDIEEHIRKALEEGQFKDLPGKGKPLSLDDNPHEDPEWRLAHHMLRNSGYSLPWIEQRQEIERLIAAARLDLQRAWEWRKSPGARQFHISEVEKEWQKARVAFEKRAGDINRRIRDFNLVVPTSQVQLRSLNVEDEISRLAN